MSTPAIVLVDTNPAIVRAWRRAFEGTRGVSIVQGSMLTQPTSAWVSPTNTEGRMSGGLDAVIRNHLGARIQPRVRQAVLSSFGGRIPLGAATCVATGRYYPAYLISTPTMVGPADDVSETLNVALACGAALQAAALENMRSPNAIQSIAIPGLGTGTGRVSPDLCADLMLTAIRVFAENEPGSFQELRAALENELGDLGVDMLPGASPARGARVPATASSAPTRNKSWLESTP
ncbi:MAG: macro domain-containing protein [Polyangiaceae bacterium]